MGSIPGGLQALLDVVLVPGPLPVVLLLVALLWYWRSGPSDSTGAKLDPSSSASSSPAVPDAADPRVGFCKSLGAPDTPHLEACFVPSTDFFVNNLPAPTAFDNEQAEGNFLALHRATFDAALDKSGDYAYGSYFKGKKRLWELRVQMRFKKPPKVSDFYFGIELEQYVPMSRATKRTQETLVGMLKKVVGNQIYHSPGDNPEATSGELETPVFVMPLWAYDQFVVTPEGETPPSLADPAVSSMGSVRFKRIRQFKAEMEKLEFKEGPTYSFCFWGISQWMDIANWVVKMPFVGTLDFNLFCGAPPVHVVMYSLKDKNSKEKRHLQSRKEYYFDLAFWSSRCRPPLDRIEALLKDTGQEGHRGTMGDEEGSSSPLDKLRNRASSGGWRGGLSCCTGR